jgi:alpha-L-fucosidase
MKNEVDQAVRELVTQYGQIDALWWDGGWLGQHDRDGAFFWEPGKFRDTTNEWPVDADYGETDDATGRPLGLTGLLRNHQPDVVATPRSGWIGDYEIEEGGSVPTGEIRTGRVTEKCFSVGMSWGYNPSAVVMSYEEAMDILVNSWVRDITCLVNVGPGRDGTVPAEQADVLRQIGTFLTSCGSAVHNTRGGPWNPVDGEYGFTYRDDVLFIHLLPGYTGGTSFTTPSLRDAKVVEVLDLGNANSPVPYAFNEADGTVTITEIDRERENAGELQDILKADVVLAVALDRPVQPSDIAAGTSATASSEEQGNAAANAVDGSTATRWSAANGNVDQWLRIDLGSAASLTGPRIAWELDGQNYRYRIEGSTDNSTWTTLDETATDSTSQVRTSTFSTEARHVRVTVTGLPEGTWASIRSLELYDRPFTDTLSTSA